jgi:spoIIIJ-associated protein
MFMDADLVPEAEQDDEAQVAKVVLETLLEHMSLRTTIEIRRAKAGEGEETTPWVLNITGTRFASRLVGRRGETLASLQYLTRLITSRELQRRAELIVDVDGYKAKRAASLRALATRLADDAVQSQRTVTLEPMPPHERRIIHLALRERADVTTRSIGEGTARKVTILPSSSE